MGAISSINFKKSNAIQTRHNDRDLPPNYLIGGDYECNRTHKEALTLKNQIIKNSIEKYTEITGQKFQAKSYEWSSVVNIKPNTTMQDLERLALFLNEKYGFQCYQIAIHRDEGHINEQGQKEINHHAHLEFITLNKENGRNMWRRELITPKVLRQMQSEVAEILEMQRGQDKRITKRQRIEPRKYAQMKEAEKKGKKELKQELLSAKEIKERLEAERKAWILEKNHTAEEYKKLRELNNQQYQKINDLENAINALKLELEAEKKKNKELKEKTEKLEQETKKRDDFIANLAKMLNFRDLNYNTPLNELERYLNQNYTKNDEIHQKENKNDLRAISDTKNDKNKTELEETNEQIDENNKKMEKLLNNNRSLYFIKELDKNNLSDYDKNEIIKIAEDFIDNYGESVWLDRNRIKDKDYKCILVYLKEELPRRLPDQESYEAEYNRLTSISLELHRKKRELENPFKSKLQDFTAQQTKTRQRDDYSR